MAYIRNAKLIISNLILKYIVTFQLLNVEFLYSFEPSLNHNETGSLVITKFIYKAGNL